MQGYDALFHYFTRRARQEQVAAINARSRAAEKAHRRLSGLYAAQAVLAVDQAIAIERAAPCC